MLDRLIQAASEKLNTHKSAVLAQREAIEKELASDNARDHAGTILKNSEGFSTSLRRSAENAQKEYARARREWAKKGIALAPLALTLAVARERRDETARALREQEAAEATRQATNLHPDVRRFYDHLFNHEVEPRHLINVRPETIAIIADLIRWDGHDPEMLEAASPMHEVFELYAERSILVPGQLDRTARSVPFPPVAAVRYTDPQYYMFDELLPPASQAGARNNISDIETACNVVEEPPVADAVVKPADRDAAEALIVLPDPVDGRIESAPTSNASAPATISLELAHEMATGVYEANPFKLGIYWPDTGVERDDYDSGRLIPALEAWIASGESWSGAESFLRAAHDGQARAFIEDVRARGVARLAQELVSGNERAVADARRAGFAL